MIDGVEADDVIGTLAVRATAQGMKTIRVDRRQGSRAARQRTRHADQHDEPPPISGPAPSLHAAGDVLDVEGVKRSSASRPNGSSTTSRSSATRSTTSRRRQGRSEGPPRSGSPSTARSTRSSRRPSRSRAGRRQPATRARLVADGTQLVTVKTDCELDAIGDITTSLVARDEDRDALIELFDRYAFKTWLREVSIEDASTKAAGEPPAEQIEASSTNAAAGQARRRRRPSLRDHHDEGGARRLARPHRSPGITAFDTETTSLDWTRAKLVGVVLGRARRRALSALAHRSMDANGVEQLPFDETLARVRRWLEDPTKKKVGRT